MPKVRIFVGTRPVITIAAPIKLTASKYKRVLRVTSESGSATKTSAKVGSVPVVVGCVI
jgi:hypothetical protein